MQGFWCIPFRVWGLGGLCGLALKRLQGGCITSCGQLMKKIPALHEGAVYGSSYLGVFQGPKFHSQAPTSCDRGVGRLKYLVRHMDLFLYVASSFYVLEGLRLRCYSQRASNVSDMA